MSFWEKIKNFFSGLDSTLNQIPDADRIESYRYDEIAKKWVLLSQVSEPEQPILDENRRLLVDTPNYVEFYYENFNDRNSHWIFEKLDFYADSLTIAIYDMSGTDPIFECVLYYALTEKDTGARVTIDTFEKGANTDNEVKQWDLKPFNRFLIDISPNSARHDGVFKVKMIFSKQKKTKISDVAYDESVFNGITDVGLSKNVFRDLIESITTLILANTTPTEVEAIITAELVDGQSIDNRIDDLISNEGHPDHNNLANLNAGTVYEHISAAQVAALHAVVVAGNLNHNDLANLNAGTDYEHLSAAQVSALHAVLTNLNQLSTRNHNDLQNIQGGAELQHLTAAQVSALHAVVVAGNLNHNDLANLNEGTVYEHISAAQVAALHAVVVAGNLNHNDLANLNAGTDYEHLSAAQVSALHAVLTNLTQLSTRNHNDLLNIQGGADLQHLTAAQVAALHTIFDGYTKAEVDTINAIGIANKRWITLDLEGANPFSAINVSVNYANVGATDYIMIFGMPFDLVVNGKNLVITDTKITIGDADGTNYLDRIRFFGLSGTITQTTLLDDGTNRLIGNFTYGHADFTVGGTYRRGIYYLNIVATNANAFDMQALEMEYYYA